MMRIFKTKNWGVELLPGWQGQHYEECSIIHHPNGMSALQVSAYRKSTIVSLDDLTRLADEYLDTSADLEETQQGSFEGYTLDFDVDNEFWQHWYLRHESTALFITYNCEVSDRDQEVSAVKGMVSSLFLP